MNDKDERRKAADHLFRGIMNNKKAEWWKEKGYVERYSLEEIEQALGNVFTVFDEDWLKHTLNVWVEKDGRGHYLIQELAIRGLWPLVILVEFGKDLEELRRLNKFDLLVKELRNPSKFIAVWLESEIAAHCLRNRYSVELYPKVRGKVPDLKISFDSEEVMVEIKEIGSGEMEVRYYEVMDFLASIVMPNIPQGISVKVTANTMPNDSELTRLARAIVEYLQQQTKEKVVSLKMGRLKALIEIKEDKYTSFSLTPPEAIALNQLKRLGRSIKHEARQIPLPYVGLVVLDAAILQGFSDEVIRDVVVKTFKKYSLPNIIAVVIVRSYKFYRLPTETEIISVPNPHQTKLELLKTLDKIFTFSRTRNLLHDSELPNR
jgi:hypothetical protein